MNNQTSSITDTFNSIIENSPSKTPYSSQSLSSSSEQVANNSSSWFSTLLWVFVFLFVFGLLFTLFICLTKGTQDIITFTDKVKVWFNNIKITYDNVVNAISGKDNKQQHIQQINQQNIHPNEQTTSLKPNDYALEKAQEDLKKQQEKQMNTDPLKYTLSKNEKDKYDSDDELSVKYGQDDSASSIQTGKYKKGWCYVGEYNNVKSCVEVGMNDECLSGNIFPSRDLCVNPKLRA